MSVVSPTRPDLGMPPARKPMSRGKKAALLIAAGVFILFVSGVVISSLGAPTEEAAPSGNGVPEVSVAETPVAVTIEAPKLLGLSVKEAKAALQQAVNEAGGDASLELAVERGYSSKPAGSVTDWLIGGLPNYGNADIESGDTITLVIAKAIPSMPNVVDMEVRDATARLEARGYAVETKKKGSSLPPGTVLAQSVPPGKRAIPDQTTVRLTVAKVPPLTVSQENAIATAEDYLDFSAFSASGLIDQLEFEGFSTADAQFAVSHITVNWNEQAAKHAKDYLDLMPFSRQGLIDQLVYEGYTYAQATYGVNQTGL
jgi:hypothetical protein